YGTRHPGQRRLQTKPQREFKSTFSIPLPNENGERVDQQHCPQDVGVGQSSRRPASWIASFAKSAHSGIGNAPATGAPPARQRRVVHATSAHGKVCRHSRTSNQALSHRALCRPILILL